MRRLKKSIFLSVCGSTLLVLGAVRMAFPGVACREEADDETEGADSSVTVQVELPEGAVPAPAEVSHEPVRMDLPKLAQEEDGSRRWHPVKSVPSYAKCFPDVQDVQIVAARKWGVKPVRSRQEAEHRKQELLYVGASPFYCIDSGMTHSIPYLVPRAGELLTAIGRNYLDSLYVKGIPLHRIIVSSILRTEDDVSRLQRGNGNATSQSCHLFGTTMDICQNRFSTVSPPGQPRRRTVQNDTLKWVLSEVLRDLREQGRCYVKYEKNQGCFHITVR